jgi:hypothetical protein
MSLGDDMKLFKSDMFNAVDSLQNKQKIHLESVKYILEHSGSSRVKNLTNRVLGEGKIIKILTI